RASVARCRVPSRHCRPRQPDAPALPAACARAGRMAQVSARRSCAFLRLLHRQLSIAGTRADSAIVRVTERIGALTISPFSRDALAERGGRASLARRGQTRKRGGLLAKLDLA